MITIRYALDTDYAEIFKVHESAFGTEQSQEIIDVVHGLLGDKTGIPLLSLVAEIGGRIVGHILFSAVRIPSSPQFVSAQILAPLGVSKEHQRQGVGGALINEGLRLLTASGVELVFVLGHPDYYQKFGFRAARVLGYQTPYPISAEYEDAWMVQELKTGIIGSVEGKIQCAETLEQPVHWQ